MLPTERQQTMPNVVLIMRFEVPEGRPRAFLTHWHAAATHLRSAAGCISTQLQTRWLACRAERARR